MLADANTLIFCIYFDLYLCFITEMKVEQLGFY